MEPSRRSGGSSPVVPGPVRRGLDQTPKVLWLTVGLMTLGACLAGGALIALRSSNATALGLSVAAVLLLGGGAVLGRRHHMMRDVS